MSHTYDGYMTGFGNHFASEAIPGTLSEGRNSPQRVAHGLYAEQLSGTAFTAPRAENRRSWLYRIRPAAMHGPFAPYAQHRLHSDFSAGPVSPDQMRWSLLPMPDTPTDFVDGLYTMAGNGSPDAMHGVGIHLYAANRSMQGRYFYDADGELLIVPQQGSLRIATEFGVIDIEPQQIAVIPRGVRFLVELPDGEARGYVCENFGAALRLPDLGLRPMRMSRASSNWSPSSRATCGGPTSAIRRWTSWVGTATTRSTATTCAVSTRSGPSASIIRIRRYSWC